MELLQPIRIEFDYSGYHYKFKTTIGRNADWSNIVDMEGVKKFCEPIRNYDMDNSTLDNEDGTWSLVMNCNGYLFEMVFDNPDEDDTYHLKFALKYIDVWDADNVDKPLIDEISKDDVEINAR